MRFVTWNCHGGGFRRKAAKVVAELNPDILVVQELEPFDDQLSFDKQPTHRYRMTYPDAPRRGIGAFSYGHVSLVPAMDCEDVVHGFHPFVARRGEQELNVIAVWTAVTEPGKASYRQAHEGLRRYAEWISQRPTVILGDFNINASYDGGKHWRQLLDLTQPLGLVSAYHHRSGEPPGEERSPTYFHRRKEGRPFHLDYCFLSSDLAERLKLVEVGAFEKWHDLSDHMPARSARPQPRLTATT